MLEEPRREGRIERTGPLRTLFHTGTTFDALLWVTDRTIIHQGNGTYRTNGFAIATLGTEVGLHNWCLRIVLALLLVGSLALHLQGR